MAYYKKGFWRSYSVNIDGYPVKGYNSKKEAIKHAKKIGGNVIRYIERPDRTYNEETVIFVS